MDKHNTASNMGKGNVETRRPSKPWNHKSSTAAKGNVGYDRAITCFGN